MDHEHWDHLQDQRDHDKEKDQNAEHLVLETLLGVVGHEEGETDDKRLCLVLALAPFDPNREMEELTEPIVNNALELI